MAGPLIRSVGERGAAATRPHRTWERTMGQTMRSSALRACLTTTAIALALGSHAPRAMAQAQTFDFAIAAQPVRQTLNEIARVTGLAVVYEETAAASVAANPVSGRQSASGAIDSALAGTGLAWRQS